MTGVYQKMKRLCPGRANGGQQPTRGFASLFPDRRWRSKWAYTKATINECAIPRKFETYLHIPNAAGRLDIVLKVSPLIVSISFSKRPDNLHLWRLSW